MQSLARHSIALLLLAAVADSARAQEHASLPSPLRLEHVIRFARAHRGEITAARARARAAAERPAIVSALDDPTIEASVDHLPFELMGADFSVSIEQRFPLSGVLGNRADVARAAARRWRAEIGRVRLDVELDAAIAFLMLVERRKTATILDGRLALAREVAAAANARYAAATGSEADALRAELQVARIEGDARALRADARGAEAMLNASLGRPAYAPLPIVEYTPATDDLPSARTVRHAALDGRPELEVARAEVAGARAEIDVMESMYGPMAMVRTGPAYTMSDGPGWMLMIGVSVPIWTELSAGVREAEAMHAMALADQQAMRRMIEGEAAAARESVVASRERFVTLREEVLPRAERAIGAFVAGYSAGTLPLVSLLEAMDALWSVQGELVLAEIALGIAWLRLDRATAGGAR